MSQKKKPNGNNSLMNNLPYYYSNHMYLTYCLNKSGNLLDKSLGDKMW